MNTHKGKIALEGLRLFAHHGYYEEERLLGREFILDIYVEADLATAGRTDQLGDTLNYEKIIDLCKEEMKIPSRLLEHVAHRIRERILALTGRDAVVKVRISKPNPLLGVELGRFYVELG
ncbi:MAG TPA: dihydroneopterin aldolase [Saprospiraceae bacterium]|nr:dihydroneopterin aldolase [Saprospiraceae bacterium]HNT21638.1 dihydroneopterin aldolase [Saprospiraceae bacterium]